MARTYIGPKCLRLNAVQPVQCATVADHDVLYAVQRTCVNVNSISVMYMRMCVLWSRAVAACLADYSVFE